ncbi:SufS family cysteine desulfurase [Methylobacterium sp. ID0610]|uniref:SufS family cysteine desulfurase n=1 Tax=Methylobacterium carpenticola TaxID=3344827 RepID=UPI0036814E54
MTTPEAGFHQSPVSPAALPGEAAHADLVARLAREIYGQGQALSRPLTPALPGPAPHPSVAPPAPPLPGLDGAALAALIPGGPDLLRTIAQDHPRAAAFAQALAPGLVPAAPAAPAPAGAAPETPDYYFLPPDPRGAPALPVATAFDVERVRKDFPALHQSVNGHRLVWLDNAATTHKPQSVIDATSRFYAHDNSNIHRAAHTLAARATDAFEGGREAVRRFLNARSTDEIVFLRGTTEAINLVANSFGRANLGPGDEIIVSTIEHHANIVPWQMVTQATGATLRVIPVNDRGELMLDQFAALLSGRTKIVSVTQVANALGTVNPIPEIIGLSHAYGVPVLVDAAQSSPHMPLDVQALDADFLVFSGHKVFGPTGIGALYGKKHLLEAMPPWQGGGHMIEDVTFARTVYRGVPEKFEAGTPDIAGAVGLGAALDYLQGVGLPAIAAYEHDLLDYAQGGLAEIRGLRLLGTARHKASVMSFVIEGQENAAVAQHLDRHGIAVRAGHHCALPALRRFGVSESVRASLAFYNTREDVDVFLHALRTLPRR